ncbi:MAG: tetratricopeptide repeat protein [Bryobacteraceae bacterium]
MGRSFSRAEPSRMMENFEKGNRFYHKASERHYEVTGRGGRYFLRRHQIGPNGQPVNVLEKEIHHVMGSGNHARTYIHRTPENRLIELPVGWYSEKGGYFAMSPGYDQAQHPGFGRNISFDCMFCHNGYPKLAPGADGPASEALFPGTLPEGIDCQRCHGPGQSHVEAAQKRTGLNVIRSSILNPSRLSPERQIEVCMQCHLETTSFPLPNSIPRYDRGAFSYKPAEPLSDFILHFDHGPGAGREEKYEIVNSVYRLRKSACFIKSGGKLLCTTCHNPHDIPRGERAVEHYVSVCRQCHQPHTSEPDCLTCHMPKRRTEDVVHAVMTDHLITRRKPAGDLLAPLAERQEKESRNPYRGEVTLYYPKTLPEGPERDLYLAAAQVVQRSNLKAGIPQLTSAIEKHKPASPVFYFQLAQAHLAENQTSRAIAWYEEALAKDPNFLPALRSLGAALIGQGQLAQAMEVLERATSSHANDSNLWHQLARACQQSGRLSDAAAAARRATQLEPELADAHNTLGGILAGAGDRAGSEAAFREAIRQRPDYAEARFNLAALLAATDRLREAEHHAGIAVRSAPQTAGARELLGNLLAVRGAWGEAIGHYREAVRLQPGFARAHLGLGTALAATGNFAEARQHLTRAAAASDAAIQQEARELLGRLPGI